VSYKTFSADAMFDLADTSGDGLLSREEFMYYMQSNTDHTKAMIRDAFYMIDVDGNGDITRDEVRNAFLKKRRDLKGETISESKRTMEGEYYLNHVLLMYMICNICLINTSFTISLN